MNSRICSLLGIEFPLVAFSHCRDVVVEVSRAGGLGVLGAKEHAIKQVKAGVDILVVSGGEGGGHCGEVSTMVLVPEVARAIRAHGDVPILAAGGIVTGEQMAACMAMGAAGAWTDAWEAEGSPRPLPMPLQGLVSEPALRQIDKLADAGHEGAQRLATYWVGQGVGLMDESTSVRNVVYEFKRDFLAACERLQAQLG